AHADEATAAAEAQFDVFSALTQRERQVAMLAGRGKRTREIATQLYLSPRTVDAHLARIYHKLNVSSRIALAGLILGPSNSGA
ncbi:MAG: response regulator transcription factor, partial [Actinocrinis sp.]